MNDCDLLSELKKMRSDLCISTERYREARELIYSCDSSSGEQVLSPSDHVSLEDFSEH